MANRTEPSLAPLVSVVMAVNRNNRHLHTAIQSILDQSMTDFEFIIIANGRNEDLWTVLQSIKDDRVRLLRTDIEQLPFSLNLGIQHAKSPYVARMDADDVAAKERLAIQCKFLDENKHIDVVGTRYRHIDDTGQTFGKSPRLRLTPREIHKQLPYESCVSHPTAMVRRDSVLAVGGYAYGLYAEDWDLWIRMNRAGLQLANLNEVLLFYRIHDRQMTSLRHFRRNLANVVALQIREFIAQGRAAFVLGLVVTFWRAFLSVCVFLLKRNRP
jgi:glycosyltransferase involved in cell wall biosynthesis